MGVRRRTTDTEMGVRRRTTDTETGVRRSYRHRDGSKEEEIQTQRWEYGGGDTDRDGSKEGEIQTETGVRRGRYRQGWE